LAATSAVLRAPYFDSRDEAISLARSGLRRRM
jgi:hypothetical protein